MPSIRESQPDKIDDILRRFPQKKSASIPLLYLAWDVYGYISPEAMEEVAEILDASPAFVEGVATFYTMFPLKPRGKYHIEICNNISCHLVGANSLLDALEKKLGIRSGECQADGRFSLQTVECLAGCSWAPCLQINGKDYFNVQPETIGEIIDSLE